MKRMKYLSPTCSPYQRYRAVSPQRALIARYISENEASNRSRTHVLNELIRKREQKRWQEAIYKRKKSTSCKFADIRLGAQYPPTRQFHALASNEKSIGRRDIIRRCTMGNKLRNYHTKRLPVPSTMATKPWNRLNGVSAIGATRGARSPFGYIICLSKSAL